MDATQKLINSMKSKPEVRTPIATEMYLPNHSGDLSAGIINTTPTADNDPVNKAYVDSLTSDLRDDSIADALHRHSELSASDGTPNPALKVDASGNVGIGTSTPDSKLHLVGSTDDTTRIKINRTTAGTNVFGNDYIGTFSNNALRIFTNSVEKIRIDANGNIGIGTISPSTKLDVNGSVNLGNVPLTTAGSLNNGYYVYKSGTTAYGMKLQYTGTEYGTMIFASNQTNRFIGFGKVGAALEDDDMIEYMRVDLDNGYVGIGTSSPTSMLHSYENNSITGAANGLTIEQAGTGDSKLQFLLTGQRRWIAGIDNSDSDKFIIGQGDNWTTSKDIVVDLNGNVGIGTSSPSEKLDVYGNINLTGVLKIDDVQILREQQAHIEDLKTDYVEGDLDTAAEIATAINATNTKINAILAMLETHGLVATS